MYSDCFKGFIIHSIACGKKENIMEQTKNGSQLLTIDPWTNQRNVLRHFGYFIH